MSDVSSLLGAEAAPYTVDHAGKTYRFGLITQAAKSAWERHLWHEARQAMREACEGLGAEAQGRAAAELARQKAAHQFSFFSDASQAALKSFSGQAVMASILGSITRAEADALLLARPAEMMQVIEDITNESFADLLSLAESRRDTGGEGGEAGKPKGPPAA